MKIPFSSDKNIIFYLMRHSSKSLAVCLLACLCFVPLNAQRKPDLYRKGWIDFNKNGVKDVYEDPHAPLDERVEDLLSQMTIEEKTCQLATLYGSGRVLRDSLPTEGWKDEIWKDGIANIDEQANGLGTFGSSISYPYANSVRNRQAIQRWFVEETRLGIPVDFTNEGIRGLCHDRATLFPSQSGQGATWNRELVSRIAEATAQEAVALGYTNIYSPILDVARDPRWGRVVECYGEDPYLVGELGKQTITALQAHGLVSTPKHFAVYSVPVGGRDEGTRTDPHVAPREMRTLLLEPFRKGIQEAGALGVMSSYNDYDGEPITGSYHFLTEILRQQWGFGGYVVSDSEAVDDDGQVVAVSNLPEPGFFVALPTGLAAELREKVGSTGLQEGKIDLSGLLQLTSGLSQLAQSYSAFHEGLVSYAGGVDALSANWSSVYSGISSLASGAGELSDGVAALDEETSKIPELIDELTGGPAEDESADASAQASFLDERNGDTASVQFVIMTEGISEPEAEAEPAPAEEEQGFFAELWDRIVALFT